MKLKFDANQQFQLDAIKSITDIFDGLPQTDSISQFSLSDTSTLFQSELGIGNNMTLIPESILKNVQIIQKRNDIEASSNLENMNFTIEMETGTGKTYVYLRTIFELNEKYGFKKFVIVVPSIAIREGVNHSIKIMKSHFQAIYNNIPFNHYIYDSRKPSILRQYAQTNQLQILIMNIDAFKKNFTGTEEEVKSNVIFKENDKLSGRKPIDFVEATHPIVIIDEPQSVDTTEKAKEAIKALNPLCILRYSATHRELYNLMYRLDPVKAYELGLVKQIAVASVLNEESHNDAFVKLLSVDNRNGIKAKIALHMQTTSGPKEKTVTVKAGSDLFTLSDEREVYRTNYIVDEINTEPENEYIRFSGGKRLTLGKAQGGLTDEIQKIQMKNAIKEHLDKELQLKDLGIKVLTLFFIDRVKNYRFYDEGGNPQKGKFSIWFDELYKDLIQRDEYKDLIRYPLDKIHDGYFAQDKKGVLKDTNGNTQADDEVYDKIMKNKEKLLMQDEPLRFIFSHSALREGWDNPNVFQICTLNETGSEIKKRQEIGRGLRLPVNQQGERVFDKSINKLVVIANESYDDFARKLQAEYEDDLGVKFGRIPVDAFTKITQSIDNNDVLLTKEESKVIWENLKGNGYINEDGVILPKYNPESREFTFDIDNKFENVKFAVMDVLESYQFKRFIKNENNRRKLIINKQVFLDEEFKILWEKINKKTTYSVFYKTEEIINNCITSIKLMDKILPIKIQYIKALVDIDERGVGAREVKNQITTIETSFLLPDIISYIQKETELTRHTISQILIKSKRLDEFSVNPQRFMDCIVEIIKKELNKLILDGIKYEKIAGEEYEMQKFEEEEIVSYLNNLITVDKSVYDCIEYESEVERKFAEDLDKKEYIKLFVKLPYWFKISTPLGTYNPDWAIVKHEDATLYLVRETKSTKDFDKLRNSEAAKIRCGEEHFKTLGLELKTVTNANEI